MRCLPALLFTTLLIQLPLLSAVISDLDRLKEIWKRIVDFITLGGVALALLGGLVFLLTWVLPHLRRPGDQSRRFLSRTALVLALVPVLLTGVAAAGLFVPELTPFILRAFALAVAVAAVAWCVCSGALSLGGTRRDLARTRPPQAPGRYAGNQQVDRSALVDADGFDFRLPGNSPLRGKAMAPGSARERSLTPAAEFRLPAGTRPLVVGKPLSAGALQ